jgi:hypothetical protein
MPLFGSSKPRSDDDRPDANDQGIAADFSFANGINPKLAKRVASVLAMFFGAALGAVVIHYSVSAALWLATAISAGGIVSLNANVREAVTARLCVLDHMQSGPRVPTSRVDSSYRDIHLDTQ